MGSRLGIDAGRVGQIALTVAVLGAGLTGCVSVPAADLGPAVEPVDSSDAAELLFAVPPAAKEAKPPETADPVELEEDALTTAAGEVEIAEAIAEEVTTEEATTEEVTTDEATTEEVTTEEVTTEEVTTDEATTAETIADEAPAEDEITAAANFDGTPEERELRDKVRNLVQSRFGGDWRVGFRHYDRNGNDKLSSGEVNKILSDAGVGNWFTRGGWVEGVMEKLDSSGDLKISWDEFAVLLGPT
jgi:hypothetical protein